MWKETLICFQVRKCNMRTFFTNRMLRSEEKCLEIKEDNGVKTLILNHAASRNSLSLEMLKSLLTNIKKDEDNKDLRSIVIKSGLEKIFSAGHNIKELRNDWLASFRLMRTFTRKSLKHAQS